jgi:signal transduction histidine kinase
MQPLISCGAVVILIAAALRHKGRQQWAWFCFAFGMCTSIVGSTINVIIANHPSSLWSDIAQNLFLLTYVLAFVGMGLYLPLRSWWIGSTPLILFNSLVVGVASFVLLSNLSLLMFGRLNLPLQRGITFLAFDLGLIFALIVIMFRYGRGGGHLLFLSMIGVLCLVIADVIYPLVALTPISALSSTVVSPLYTFHRILLSFGAYRSVDKPPTPRSVAFKVMPLGEWLVWMILPGTLVFSAIVSAIVNGQSIFGTVGLLLILAAVRELLAAYDYRRAQRELHAAEEDERQTSELLRQQKAIVEEANQRLRAYMAQAEDLAIEQERIRVAREIHDGLGHHLNNIKIHIGVAHRFFESDRTVALDSVATVKTEISEAQRELRRAVDALVSDDFLAGALEDLFEEPIRDCKLAGIRTNLQISGTPRHLPEQVKHTLYRIGQEALSNIRQHSRAKHATMIVDYGEQCVRIIVEDDGIGIPTNVEWRRGHGLDNLQERAALIGGNTDIETRPGQGVRVVVEVPA